MPVRIALFRASENRNLKTIFSGGLTQHGGYNDCEGIFTNHATGWCIGLLKTIPSNPLIFLFLIFFFHCFGLKIQSGSVTVMVWWVSLCARKNIITSTLLMKEHTTYKNFKFRRLKKIFCVNCCILFWTRSLKKQNVNITYSLMNIKITIKMARLEHWSFQSPLKFSSITW